MFHFSSSAVCAFADNVIMEDYKHIFMLLLFYFSDKKSNKDAEPGGVLEVQSKSELLEIYF